MYFANRHELLLPEAPDTLWFWGARAVLWISGIGLVAALSSLGVLAAVQSDFYIDNFVSVLAYVPAWHLVFLVHLVVRERYERRYWTARRVAQRCPYLWQLYLVGCTAPPSRNSAHIGSAS
jgi:hypothetical protein